MDEVKHKVGGVREVEGEDRVGQRQMIVCLKRTTERFKGHEMLACCRHSITFHPQATLVGVEVL